MGQTYQELYEGYLKADKDKVAAIAKEKFTNIVKRVYSETNDQELAFHTAVLTFSTFVVMDDKLSNEEWALFQYIMQQQLPREDVIQICKCAENGKGAQIINNLADNDKDFKKDVVVLGLCVCAIDGNISPDEHNLLKFYMD